MRILCRRLSRLTTQDLRASCIEGPVLLLDIAGKTGSYFLSSFFLYDKKYGGQGRIRTFEGVSRQIYSLFHLTALVPAQNFNAEKGPVLLLAIASKTGSYFLSRFFLAGQKVWSWRKESNLQPMVYKTIALPLSYASKIAL